MERTPGRKRRSMARRIVFLVVLFGLIAYIVSDGVADALGLDDNQPFDVPDDAVILDGQPVQAHADLFFRPDLPLAASPWIPDGFLPFFSPSALPGSSPRTAIRPVPSTCSLPRAHLHDEMATSPAPAGDPAS